MLSNAAPTGSSPSSSPKRAPVVEWIDEAGGFLPLETFMHRALHDPEHGYYSRHIQGVGREGDFSTSATLSSLLGRALAQWSGQVAASRGRFRWNLIEVGGGTGVLAEAVLSNLPPLLRLGSRFHMVEVSEPLRQQQRECLGRRVHWHDSLPEALEACGGKAIIYSNELLDVFPVMQFIWRQSRWEVVGLERGDGDEAAAVRETSRPPTTEEEVAALQFMVIDPSWECEGRRLEVQWSLRRWIREWAPHHKQGVFLAIDYGESGSVLPNRHPYGSLRAYYQHLVLDGEECYRRAGRQDLTVDVNFSHLRCWMEEAGFTMTSFMEQRDFLIANVRRNWSLASESERRLTDEFGAGGAFKVAIFERNGDNGFGS